MYPLIVFGKVCWRPNLLTDEVLDTGIGHVVPHSMTWVLYALMTREANSRDWLWDALHLDRMMLRKDVVVQPETSE